jgi:hypothetical protein
MDATEMETSEALTSSSTLIWRIGEVERTPPKDLTEISASEGFFM